MAESDEERWEDFFGKSLTLNCIINSITDLTFGEPAVFLPTQSNSAKICYKITIIW